MKVTGSLAKGAVVLNLNNNSMHDADMWVNGLIVGLTVNDMRVIHELIGTALRLEDGPHS
jgi:hypothetical protein